MDLRLMEKKIWAILWNLLNPEEDYNLGYRWVKKQFREDGFINSDASSDRFDKAWIRVRKKMQKMAK